MALVAGMSKAFMKAGAKNIIMTLWSVDDEKSALLMKKFYEGVKRGLDYSDALREAKIFMIKDKKTESPFYWSGFVGSGI
ncbi:FOG: TPR repeat [hydrothermal vent metagenome]|uniref:FOG: TPR repeat n=1 Tax=hydrothermal vent metagenome TaxID=652676 RepID=A0A1W1CVS2_9ZZZZ